MNIMQIKMSSLICKNWWLAITESMKMLSSLKSIYTKRSIIGMTGWTYTKVLRKMLKQTQSLSHFTLKCISPYIHNSKSL